MSLSPDEVRRVAHLARLQLTDAELASMTRQLSDIVSYFDVIKAVDAAGVEPLAHALPVHNVFRDDEPTPSLTVEQALANAPEQRKDARGDRFYAVPAVLD
jgi:aspartyl-tRNA(Asn)/glutamyl-tRNA(Gln) amidotransferase subunit C